MANSEPEECFVYITLSGDLQPVTAGIYQLDEVDGNPLGRFVYREKYLKREDSVALAPLSLPLSDREFTTTRNNGIFNAFRDAMPDYWGRLVLQKAQGTMSDFELLTHNMPHRAGGLDFGDEVEASDAVVTPDNNTVSDLSTIQETANEIVESGESTAENAVDVERLLEAGTSVGGARPKTTVKHNDKRWIAKLSRPDDRWDHPRVEYAMLLLAEHCGLDVPECRLEDIGDRTALLVKRFDRTPDGGRRRMISAVTLLGTSDDPTARREWSYLRMADCLRQVTGVDGLTELYKRMCFNAVISNTDDHPRNHALIADRDWRLSSVYDLTPSPSTSKDRRDLAMSCGEYGRYANRENLLSASERFGLSRSDAGDYLDHIEETVKSEWLTVLEEASVSEHDRKIVDPAPLYEGYQYDPEEVDI